ncbi:hypothetical protein Acor_71700 [Acrocarpospora corrugata]|uniref:Uncharacterized protein n=1 Tax=Acrocarpospora corrugata TaxID=35763 RepID=A0A5M3WAP4_9ACTN|nr:hypothetical protein Acor_71700 [Acrocarpospora corrugata]
MVEELADGLQETYRSQLTRLGDPEAAARAAIAEFGDADTVTAAFFRDSPWRRMAVILLATGPMMGAVWGLGLVSAQMWNWPIPLSVRIGYGVVLVTVAGTLLAVVREKRAYRRTRTATLAGAAALIALDAVMLAAVTTVPSAASWPVAVAISASMLRITATVHALQKCCF